MTENYYNKKKISINRVNDVLIIKKEKDNDFFYTTSDSFIIPVFNLSAILKYLLTRDLISIKVLEEVVDEYRNNS